MVSSVYSQATAMGGFLLFIFLISTNTISGFFLPPPPPSLLPGFLTLPSPGRVQGSRRSPLAPAPMWTLWDLASSSSSVIGTVRSQVKANDGQTQPLNPLDGLALAGSALGTVVDTVVTEIKKNNNYHYDFHIGEKGDKNFMAHDETSSNDVVTGSYSYVDPTGALITVQYIADADGYRETRTSEPGDV